MLFEGSHAENLAGQFGNAVTVEDDGLSSSNEGKTVMECRGHGLIYRYYRSKETVNLSKREVILNVCDRHV